MIRKSTPEGSREREDVETILQATTRCKEIVRGLLDFSRQSELRKSPADINDVLRQALALTRNQAVLQRVRVREALAGDLPSAVIDAKQIEQVAVNIIVNAIDAMPGGGDLEVRTRLTQDGGGRWIEFEIKDTGCGIPPEITDRIFDPFFTTKPPGKGTGLGLAIAYGIVSEHGGRIHVDSRAGAGTTVTVRLPAPKE